MLDQATFCRQVRELFTRLDDRPYLQTHPLASLLGGPGQAASAEALRRVVLGAAGELRPPDGARSTSANWRYWQCLSLRYSDGLGTKQISRRLAVSERQVRRDHRIAVDAVAGILWAKYGQPAAQPEAPANPTLAGDTLTARESPRLVEEMLEAEVTRVASLSPEEPVSIVEALESALATSRGLIDARRARVETSIPNSLSPVSVSPVMLRQILLCLMSYALQGDGDLEIHLSAANTAEGAEVALNIRGPRLPASERQNEAGDSPDLVDTARHLVEAQGGRLRIEHPSDGLRRMVMTLPMTRIVRVLVIDDNPDFILLFRRYLAGTNYRLAQARTPPSVFELVHTLRPDVITLDVLMPSRDGWQILQQLRADPVARGIPIIVCSILPEKPLALSLGATDFLAKPVRPRSLLDALERCRGR